MRRQKLCRYFFLALFFAGCCQPFQKVTAVRVKVPSHGLPLPPQSLSVTSTKGVTVHPTQDTQISPLGTTTCSQDEVSEPGSLYCQGENGATQLSLTNSPRPHTLDILIDAITYIENSSTVCGITTAEDGSPSIRCDAAPRRPLPCSISTLQMAGYVSTAENSPIGRIVHVIPTSNSAKLNFRFKLKMMNHRIHLTNTDSQYTLKKNNSHTSAPAPETSPTPVTGQAVTRLFANPVPHQPQAHPYRGQGPTPVTGQTVTRLFAESGTTSPSTSAPIPGDRPYVL